MKIVDENPNSVKSPSLVDRKDHALASSRGRVLTKKDGIFRLIGIGKSKVAGGYSWRKHDLGI